MKPVILTLLGVGAIPFASGRGGAGLPACGISCALNAIGINGCPSTDIACVCKFQPYILGFIQCVTAACSPDDQAAAEQYVWQICASAGVSVSVPPTTSTLPEAASSSSGGAAAATTSAPTETPEITSSSAAASSEVTPASATLMPAQTAASNVTASTSPPAFTGAAAKLQSPMLLGLGALVAAAL